MTGDERIRRSEVLLFSVLVAAFAAVWVRWPEIKVSSKTLESYDLREPNRPSWHNGIGLSVTVEPASLGPEEERALTGYDRARYQAFRLTVHIDSADYPTMVDFPYERMSLTDQSGRKFILVNQQLSETAQNPNLRRELETFDWSIVNNTFSRQPRLEQGLLLFEKPGPGSTSLTLHINLYHHPYKQIDLSFPFQLPGERSGNERGSASGS